MKYAIGNMLNGAGGLNPDGLSLDLQFATDKTLTARKGPTPVFTRATTGTFIGSNGLIQSAAINAARFDHDPITLVCKGLLIEEPRTNLLNFSQTFATSGGAQNNWVDTNITRDGTLRTSPDGTSNALRITASAANGTVISSAALGTSASRVLSIFLRRVTGTGDIQYTGDNGSTWTTQVITTSWARYDFFVGSASHQVGIRIATAADAIEIWGVQLEAGLFVTSYIPTTTESVIRNADVCSISSANFTGMYNQTEGSFLAGAFTPASGTRIIVSADNNGTTEVNRTFTNGTLSAVEVTDGTLQSQVFPGSIVANTAFKLASAYKLNDFAASRNGAAPQTDNTGTLPTPNQLKIGYEKNGNILCGCVASLRYYKKRLPNAKLQSLTA